MLGWDTGMQYGCLLPGEEIQGLSEQELGGGDLKLCRHKPLNQS